MNDRRWPGIHISDFNICFGESTARHTESLANILPSILFTHWVNHKCAYICHREPTVVLTREHQNLAGLFVPEDCRWRVSRYFTS